VKFLLIAVGHRMPDWVRAGFEEYARRLPREAQLSIREVKPSVRGATASDATLQRALALEHERIAAALPAGCCKVVLDERGVALATVALASRIEQWRRTGRDVAFVIGGAEGTAPQLRKEADFLWSLSSLTLPHGLVRAILAEQLYRAVSLLRGHPYHRG
jgi:23S rRNA (pseudouridine1915-N3)-methyltransferase